MKALQINKTTNELTEMINLTLSNNCRTFAFIKEDENCEGLVFVEPAHISDFDRFDNINDVNNIIETLNEEIIDFM